MIENYLEQAYELSNIYRKISSFLLMRKLKINNDLAVKICNKVALRRHLEARKLAKEFEVIRIMDIFEMIEMAKKSEYGATWYSDKGPIHISKEGKLEPIKLKDLPLYKPKLEDA